jgi:DNA-directed RNA polymerase subunit RPC12/RpoP
MEPLDGNAIAGHLLEYFGREMTTAIGACAHCGARGQIAELRVYLCAPGSVVRCPSCGSVVMVIVTVRQELRVDHRNFALLE